MSEAIILKNAPILFFDSGVGGLSLLKEARALLPNASFIYVADTAGFPYGTKSESDIAARVPALLGRLAERFQPRLITIACNTASTIALPAVRAALNIPIVGTVPAIKPAAKLSQSKTIGLLGTEATIRQPYIDDLTMNFAPDTKIIRFGAPDLVEAAEAKVRGEKIDMKIIQAAIDGICSQDGGAEVDIIILACTHFPLLRAELSQIAGPEMDFIDGAQGIARRIVDLTAGQHWPDSTGNVKMVITGSVRNIQLYEQGLKSFGINTVDML